MLPAEYKETYLVQLSTVPLKTKVEQLAMVHIQDGDEVGVLARDILYQLDPERYPKDSR